MVNDTPFKQPEAPSPADLPEDRLDEEGKKFRKIFQEVGEKKSEEMAKVFESRISAGHPEMHEVALRKARELKDRQSSTVKILVNEERKAFENSTELTAMANRKALAETMLKKAELAADQRIQAVTAILDRNIKGKYMVSLEVDEIHNAIEGVEKILTEHPKVQEIFDKLTKSKGHDVLKPDDYQEVVRLLQPGDLKVAGGNGPESAKASGGQERTKDLSTNLRASSAGLLISLMNEVQRVKLIESFMTSEKKGDTPQLVESMLTTGLIEGEKAKGLMKKALELGAISEQKLVDDFQKKLESGQFLKMRQQYQQQMKEHASQYQAVYARNEMNRFVGKPLLGALVATWGAIELGISLMVARGTGNYASPYILPATLAIVAGTEMATGTFSTPNEGGDFTDRFGFGNGMFSRGLEWLTEGKSPNTLQMNADRILKNAYMSGPTVLREYFQAGGFESMKRLRQEILAQRGKTPEGVNPKQAASRVTIDALLKAEDSPAQRERLESMKHLALNEEEMNILLGQCSEAQAVLNFKSGKQFLEYLNRIEKTS